MNANTLGKIIYDGREKQGISKREFAKLLGVSERTISYWESIDIENSRRPKLSHLIQLSIILKIPIDMFILL